MSLKRRMKRKQQRARPPARFSLVMAFWFLIAFLVFAGGAMFHACAHRAGVRSRIAAVAPQRVVELRRRAGNLRALRGAPDDGKGEVSRRGAQPAHREHDMRSEREASNAGHHGCSAFGWRV